MPMNHDVLQKVTAALECKNPRLILSGSNPQQIDAQVMGGLITRRALNLSIRRSLCCGNDVVNGARNLILSPSAIRALFC
jgi:hypothetical protein